MTNQPVVESDRIESLDVLRVFSLLGILLLNIIGFVFVVVTNGYTLLPHIFLSIS